MVDTKTTSHLPGIPVKFKKRVIQRCAICGMKMIDMEMSRRVKLGSALATGTFPIGCYVRQEHETDMLSIITGEEAQKCAEGDDLWPDDMCISLVEADVI